MNYGIEICDVSKAYGSKQTLKGVSFGVEESSMFALLGQNGAGKSTLIDILCTLRKADRGIVKIGGYTAGKQDAAICQKIGVVFQNSMLDDLLSVEENLRSRGSCYQLFHHHVQQRIDELDAMVGLRDILHQTTATLSGGQRRRVDIARALLADPNILILDEPTTGLDLSSRAQIWSMIHHLQNEKKMTVFLTTHYLEEAKQADALCVLKEGRIIAQGTPKHIRDTYAKNRLHLYSSALSQLKKQLQSIRIAYVDHIDHLDVWTSDSMHALSVLKRTEKFISGFEYESGTLDDAFLTLMEGGDCHDDMDAGETKYAAVL